MWIHKLANRGSHGNCRGGGFRILKLVNSPYFKKGCVQYEAWLQTKLVKGQCTTIDMKKGESLGQYWDKDLLPTDRDSL